ncbi:hypothetical protein PIB30_056067 [Stylosanthes scabra]|uniref:Uncharacterized protein n=1 Tax=Stylosanthes scabra TaxID=79078 RepID=A0ABU6QJZ8_9FABA|nr:hypothetical protein [Stylosanthes scabra]
MALWNLTTATFSINIDNQLHRNKAIHSNILDDVAGSIKVVVLNNGDNQTVPKERSQEHVHVDKGKRITKDNLPLEEDTDILLGGSDPEDTGTLVNAKKLREINIIDLDEEIIAQSGNVNFTRTYLRTKAKKAARAGDTKVLNEDYISSKDFLSERKRGRPKASKGPRLLSREIGCVLPVKLKSKFRQTTEMQLTLQDCQISLYVFGQDLSEG